MMITKMVMTMEIAFLFGLLAIPEAFCITAYDCAQKSTNITVVSLDQIEDCPPLQGTHKPVLKAVQILQKRIYNEIRVHTCKVLIRERIYACNPITNIAFGEVRDGFRQYNHIVTQGACREMHNTRNASLYGTPIDRLDVNITNFRWLQMRGHTKENGDCHAMNYLASGKLYYSVTATGNAEIALHDMTVPVDTKTDEIILKSGFRCDLSAKWCGSPEEGVVVWNKKDFQNCKSDQFDALYTGQANVTTTATNTTYVTFASEKQVSALRLTGRKFDLCGQHAHGTEHKRLSVLIDFEEESPFPTAPPTPQNTDLMLYFNNKIFFVEYMSHLRDTDLAAHAAREHCLAEKELLEQAITLARHSPDPLARLFTNKPGFFSTVQGDVLIIAECATRELYIRNTSKCYQHIPVYDGQIAKFVESSTRIIVPIAKEIPCVASLAPIHYLENRWVQFLPNLTESKFNPVKLKPTDRNGPKLDLHRMVSTVGLYDEETLDKLMESIQMPSYRDAVDLVVVDRMRQYRPMGGGYHSSRMLLDRVQDEPNTSVFKGFWEFTKTFGSAASVFVAVSIIMYCVRSLVMAIMNGQLLTGFMSCFMVFFASMWTGMGQAIAVREEKLAKEKERYSDVDMLRRHRSSGRLDDRKETYSNLYEVVMEKLPRRASPTTTSPCVEPPTVDVATLLEALIRSKEYSESMACKMPRNQQQPPPTKA